MRIILLSLLSGLLWSATPGTLLAQPSAATSELSATTNALEQEFIAKFDGGPEALRTYLNTVPLPAGFQLTEGQPSEIFVSFVVDANGKVGQVRGLQPVPGNPWPRRKELWAAAVRHISAMPAWTPAQHKGKAVAATYTVPVRFVGSILPASHAYAYAEQMPVFPYPDGVQTYIGRNIRYPASALRNRTQGVVLAYYEVAENGLVDNIRIIQSVSREIDAEVKNAIQNKLPTYQPAQHQGKPVRVFFVIPIDFAIK
ncbi:TonB family protein [Hymenobacter sp. ISL-91]|uniref:energy transducer TonB n=1 Tax=Hymenobacter sp. ISL-91 TaxID=2819151 RepID=UPI001BEADB98|nr:energy transducer TonB [Hymenobacter sp. ISL-91]MBT2556204.1 TonB family protein [Hymenobacter sp. ISL-91]